MSSVTKKEEKQAVELIAQQPEPMFSTEFVQMVQDHVYETLRSYLESVKQTDAAELLDDLVCLTLTPKKEMASWLADQILSEAIGSASKNVLKLGGSFRHN